MKKTNIDDREKILVAFQTALLGAVTPRMRGVTVGWDATGISATIFFDGPISSDEVDIASELEAEIMSHFGEFPVRVESVQCDFPNALNPKMLKAWVYYRKE